MTKNPTPIPDKKLSDREMFYHTIHEECYGGLSIISVKIKVAGPLDIQLVKQACRHIWEHSPALRARIRTGVAVPFFVYDVPIRDIPVHSIFELGMTGIRQFLEKEVDTPFNSSRNLWRVLLITDRSEFDRHYLILSIHRAIGEADFALRCAQDILRACSRILAEYKDDVTSEAIPWMGEDSNASLLTAAQKENGEDAIDFSVYAPLSRRHTRIRSYTIGTDKFEALSSQCLSRKISLPGLLGAAASMAMHKNFSVHSIGIETLCFTKELLSLPGYFRFHLGQTDVPPDIWALARDCDRLMSGIPANRDYARMHASLISEIRDLKHFPARCVIEIVSPSATPDGFSLDDIAVVHGNRCATEAAHLSAVIMAETLSLTYACAYPLMDDNRSERFARDFARMLDRAIKNPHS